jgi:hypothetical protein
MIKKFVPALVVLFLAAPSLFAQNVAIDARFGIDGSNPANYFNWSQGNKTVKDKFDATTGASFAGSTALFNAVRYDAQTTRKAAIPVALRGLVLYPVSDFETATADAFTVSATGKALVVRFVHRGIAYELSTDKNGKFDLLSGAKSAKGLADNIGGDFVLKKEFLKAGGDPAKMADLDWSKIPLVLDAKDPLASRWFEGTLNFTLEKNILTVKGTLIEKKAK